MFKRAIPLVALLFVACGDGGDQLDDLALALTAAMVIAQSHPGPICICDEGSTKQNGVCMEARPPTLAKASPAVAMARA